MSGYDRHVLWQKGTRHERGWLLQSVDESESVLFRKDDVGHERRRYCRSRKTEDVLVLGAERYSWMGTEDGGKRERADG